MAMTLDLNVWVMTLDDVYSTTTDCLKCMLLLSVHHSLFNVHGVCHLVLISIRKLPVGQTVWLVACTQEVTVHTMAVNSFKLCDKLSCIPEHCPAPLVSPSLLTSSYWPRRRNGQNRGRSG